MFSLLRAWCGTGRPSRRTTAPDEAGSCPLEGEDHSTLYAMTVSRFVAEEERCCLVVLHDKQTIVTAEPYVGRCEPFDAPSNVACKERLVVIDAKRLGFATRRE